MRIVIDIPDKMYSELITWKFSTEVAHRAINAITKGRILPNGAEILTAEAYSDLCLRASKGSKTGRWARQTDDYHDYYECEICGIAVGIDDIRNYCPNCGAKMEEEGAEE